MWEETTQATPFTPLKPLTLPVQEPAKFTVKPTGEISIGGKPDEDVVRQLLDFSSYHQLILHQLALR